MDYCRKPQDILRVENYCEPIIDEETWKITRDNLEKNKQLVKILIVNQKVYIIVQIK